MKKHLLVLTFILTGSVYADVMNLNEFTPTHIEDATNVDAGKFNLQFSGRFIDEETDEISYLPVMRYGISHRLQVEAAIPHTSGGKEIRSGETITAIQYELNDPQKGPVFGLSPFVAFPTGKYSEGIDPGVKFLITHPISGTPVHPNAEFHFNFQIRHNAGRREGERAEQVNYGLGFSRKLKDKLALVLDLIHVDDEEKDSSRDFAEAGLHQEVMKGVYLSYGAAADIGDDPANWTGLLGVEVEI